MFSIRPELMAEGKLQGMRSLLRFKGVKVLGQGFDKKLVNDEMLEQFF